ncbi:ABC transporter ATP-binding protein [Oscillospiraceae bacterium MB08-C2-2]|nr:ABC transporter ATP-binding protein [Oscillospiraceae bacterium MB08-C2-2]
MKLEVRQGSFDYKDKAVLKDINLVVEKDQILTILGPNGVGKTTLLKCLMGFLKWKQGETLIDGRPFASLSRKELWQKISYVPQAKKNAFAYSVEDMIVMGLNSHLGFFDSPGKKDYQKAQEIMERIGIFHLAKKSFGKISGGELQMVLIGRALISQPEVLILDEPESNLDMRNQLKVLGLIESIKRDFHASCIINTHFPNHALKISDKTLMLGYGNLQQVGDTRQVATEQNIERFFGVRSKILPVDINSVCFSALFPYEITNLERHGA